MADTWIDLPAATSSDSEGPATEKTLQEVLASTEAIGTFVDDLESLSSAANSLLTTIRDNADQIEQYTDGLEDLITTTNSLLTTIRDNADQLEQYTDGIEALLTTGNSILQDIETDTMDIKNLLTLLNGYVDGLEGLITSTNSKLDTVNTNLGAIDGHVDGLEGLITSTNSKLDTVNTNLGAIDGHVDGLEGLITSTNSKLDSIDAGIPATLGQTTMSASTPVALASDQTPFADRTASGSLVSGDTTSAVTINCAGCGTLAFQISGSFGGTNIFEGTTNGSDWVSITCYNRNGGAGSTTTTGTGLFGTHCSGLSQFRIRRSVATSGTVVVTILANSGSGTVLATSQNGNNFIVAAIQSGTWNINNISGTISLPTGAATETTLSGINGKLNSLGQKTMANSMPVALASDQTPVQVVGNIASSASDSGNPVKTGGVYTTTTPLLTTGQRGNDQQNENSVLMQVPANTSYTSMGYSYSATNTAALLVGTSETAIFLFRNPNTNTVKAVLTKLYLASNGSIIWKIYVNPTVTATGTSITPINDRLGSTNTSVMTPFQSPTISSNGTLKRVFYSSTQSGGRDIDLTSWWAINPNKDLLITAQAGSNNTPVQASIDYHEVT